MHEQGKKIAKHQREGPRGGYAVQTRAKTGNDQRRDRNLLGHDVRGLHSDSGGVTADPGKSNHTGHAGESDQFAESVGRGERENSGNLKPVELPRFADVHGDGEQRPDHLVDDA
ncbi:hypothetical protein [Catenulispora subtropica]|uniref:Uncharacterized protein n=1 Tax=Catenulispora subtropica TaxID=450798 RepID=A0ABP5DN67_9ACTN